VDGLGTAWVIEETSIVQWMRRILVSGLLLALLIGTPTLTENADAGGYNSFPYGQCTWYAMSMRPDLAGSVWGNAWNWAYAARVSGESVGYYPQRGAVVVFQPWTQGARFYGHVGYVTSVGSNGWFQVAEMNFPYVGSITYRWAQAEGGVSFIY